MTSRYPVLMRWPGPCWVLLVEADDEGGGHYPDRSSAQADLDERLVALLVDALDDALDQLEPDHPDSPDRYGGHGGSGGCGRGLVDVVTDTPPPGQDAASRLRAAIYQRPECCWGLRCGRCGGVRNLDGACADIGADGWVHANDRAEALDELAELGEVCTDCVAAAALGSVAAPDGTLLPDPLTTPPPPPTSPSAPTPWSAWTAPRLF